jgi:hypothetical protein
LAAPTADEAGFASSAAVAAGLEVVADDPDVAGFDSADEDVVGFADDAAGAAVAGLEAEGADTAGWVDAEAGVADCVGAGGDTDAVGLAGAKPGAAGVDAGAAGLAEVRGGATDLDTGTDDDAAGAAEGEGVDVGGTGGLGDAEENGGGLLFVLSRLTGSPNSMHARRALSSSSSKSVLIIPSGPHIIGSGINLSLLDKLLQLPLPRASPLRISSGRRARSA